MLPKSNSFKKERSSDRPEIYIETKEEEEAELDNQLFSVDNEIEINIDSRV
jgi:hypothetical protein